MIIKHRTGRPAGRPAGVRSLRTQSRFVASVLAVLAVMIMGVPAIARTAAAFSDSEHVAVQITAGVTQTPTTPVAGAWDGTKNNYQGGDRVSYGGHVWQAIWYGNSQVPPGSPNTQYGQWAHACESGKCPDPDAYPSPPWTHV